MSKVCGNICFLKNKEKVYDHFLVKGVKLENRIVYLENDITVTLLYQDNKIEIKRETDDYIIRLYFEEGKKTEGTYFLKEYQQSLPLQVITNKMFYEENRVEIEYSLSIEEDFDHFFFTLELEV